ncbi:putative D-cysteine desulfhydrase 2, mitochondrial isoform X6 [Zingiber officinale]|uniref:putative D-cysteine desulfhydrase 2, mitochondrial isoform X6 n=1 Tax=Zingiber officinale TaxID=94328 RepID=UPI001C4B3198|nr:putative D-cysteine desulfhydrase 2, mitochondrial isoform X6 [Zingiber officinale]
MSLRRVTITVAAPLPPPLQTPPQLPILSRLRVAPCRRCYSNPKPSPLLRRQWMLSSPSAPIHAISFTKPSTSSFTYYSNGLSVSHLRSAEEAKPSSSFYLIRDDLLHPLVNGNKARKLDAIIPLILRHAATDLFIVGSSLIACYSNWTCFIFFWIILYTNIHMAPSVSCCNASSIHQESNDLSFSIRISDQKIALVVDAGTGTTAVGLALGIAYLGLPWKVVAVMLADTKEKYEECEKCLVSDFKRVYGLESLEDDEGIVQWVERLHPRRFGKVLDGEIDLCRQIAQQTGVPLDPIYTLAAWEQAVLFADSEDEKDSLVVMLHTGGTLGLFGLAQRYASDFSSSGPNRHAL